MRGPPHMCCALAASRAWASFRPHPPPHRSSQCAASPKRHVESLRRKAQSEKKRGADQQQRRVVGNGGKQRHVSAASLYNKPLQTYRTDRTLYFLVHWRMRGRWGSRASAHVASNKGSELSECVWRGSGARSEWARGAALHRIAPVFFLTQ